MFCSLSLHEFDDFFFILFLIDMYTCELTDYSIASPNGNQNLNLFHITISQGDVCCVRTDSLDDANLFLRALATLTVPVKGSYRFQGALLDFSDYRKLLPIKKQIGYIAQETAMLSNRTIRQNLLLMRSYFEDSLSVTLDDEVFSLCRLFGLVDKLDLRPAALDTIDLKIAMMIRELKKPPGLLILERPELFVGQHNFNLFLDAFQSIVAANIPVVFFSDDGNFINRFTTREIIVKDKNITAVDFKTK
ncbi:MAG: hypothetical protein C4522_04690 [Desulfobacteraceae bacterium]|nr:MAG: hypothetical protein C4522_04690 [Desulfobacteraceae bacterium]